MSPDMDAPVNGILEVGIALYTYDALEARADAIWGWVEDVEAWSGRPFVQFAFAPRAKPLSTRVWKASPANRSKLRERLNSEQPWDHLHMAWPSVHGQSPVAEGALLWLGCEAPPARGMEAHRRPTVLYFSANSSLFTLERVQSFVALAVRGWQIVGGARGFIDVNTGVPLHDDLFRNAVLGADSTIPDPYLREYYGWQRVKPSLDKRVWRVCWGNFLNPEVLRQVGGIQEMRRADERYRLLPEYLERAYAQGVTKLRECTCFHEWRELGNGAVFLSLSPSPLDWFSEEVQARRERLQQALGHVAVGPWDWDPYPAS